MGSSPFQHEKEKYHPMGGVFLFGAREGTRWPICPGGKSYGCHQFLNWWPPHATGMRHLNGFESFPLHKKLYPSHSRRVQFLVRERGLEPPRRNHTHLKRACLPFQHSRNDALILYLLQMVLSIVFPKDTMWFSRNVPKSWTEGGSTTWKWSCTPF